MGIASIVTNLSQLEKGRHILTKDSGELLMLIASANISNHTIRKRGILNFIVVPLMANPEDFTAEEIEPMPIAAATVLMKTHSMETDHETIVSLIESLVLLCS